MFNWLFKKKKETPVKVDMRKQSFPRIEPTMKPKKIYVEKSIPVNSNDDFVTGMLVGAAVEAAAETLMDSFSSNSSSSSDFSGGGGDFGGGGASSSWD